MSAQPTPSQPSLSQPILIGVIGRAHGVRGLVHVTSYAQDGALDCFGPLQDAAGRRFRLRLVGAGVAELALEGPAGFEKIADRDQAAALVNTRLYVDRAALPVPEDDEYYLADLVGLTAQSLDGAPLGRVQAVHDYGAGTSLEIAGDGAAGLIVPFTRAAVPVVDLAGGRILIDPPVERVMAGHAGPGDAALGDAALGDAEPGATKAASSGGAAA